MVLPEDYKILEMHILYSGRLQGTWKTFLFELIEIGMENFRNSFLKGPACDYPFCHTCIVLMLNTISLNTIAYSHIKSIVYFFCFSSFIFQY